MSPLTRRQLLVGGAAAATGAVVSRATAAPRAGRRTAPTSLPSPASSGIDHIVVVWMDNSSFAHSPGWLPGAEGRQPGRASPDGPGVLPQTRRWTERQGCGFND